MKLFTTLAAFVAVLAPAAVVSRPMTPRRADAISAAVERGMARTGTKGMALAVVEDGRVVLVRAYGLRDQEGAPLQTDTIMYGASLTKAVFAYTVQRLAQEGKINLDASIASMLPKALPEYGNVDGYGNWGDLAGDERWRRLTPRIILTHSTGFANYSFLEPDEKLKIHFDPGTRYSYSGEGYNLLQFVIEKGLGIDLMQAADRLTFGPLGMASSSFVWRPGWAGNATQGWRSDGAVSQHSMQRRPRAAGSMDTTIVDMAAFAAALVNGTGLSPDRAAELLRPQLPITTASQFPTLQAELPIAQRVPNLSAALGVETFSGPQGPGFYKGGHNDFTGNMMICVQRGRRCLVILGNDVRVEALFPEVTQAVLGETGTSWTWKYPDMAPRPSL